MKTDKVLSGQRLRIYPAKMIEMVHYTVNKGDTLSGIAERYRTNPAMIILCNAIDDASTIMSGQRLAFYAPSKGKPVIYTVKRGSNLTWISQAFKVPVQKIMKWNGLDSTTIHPGQKLKIYSTLIRDI
jgi:lysozyme